jgi:hypothetical protein
MAQQQRKGVKKMELTRRNTRLAASLIGIALAGALAPGAAASVEASSAPREQLYVNPSTGYASPAPAAPSGGTVHVNPSTGFASVGEPPASNPIAMARSTEQAATPEASDGFDWASAGIGAAAGAGLVLALMLSLATVGVGGLALPRRAS